MEMTITADPDPTFTNDGSDTRYRTDAEVRAACPQRAQAIEYETSEIDPSELGWALCGEAVLPIAGPLVALAIMLIILVA
jgi:hypothetical protein